MAIVTKIEIHLDSCLDELHEWYTILLTVFCTREK